MKYTRLFSDDEGESHFEDVEVKLSPIDDFEPPALMLASDFRPSTGIGFAKVPSGSFFDWHTAPGRQLMVVISGQFEAEVSDGEVRRFNPGDVVLAESTTGRGNKSWTVGDEDVSFVVGRL